LSLRDRQRPARRLGPLGILALFVAMMVLHQDSWLWTDRTLLLGFLPSGLAYQAGYTLLAAAVMALLVRWAWPSELEELE
jgi:hypothetical protein